MFSQIFIFLGQNHTLKQTVMKNSFWLLFGEIIARCGTFLISLWIAHHLGKEVFGTYNYVITFSALLLIFVDGGLSSLSLREVSKDPQKFSSYLINGILIKVVLSLITFIVLVGMGIRNEENSLTFPLILLFFGHAVITNILEYVRGLFRPLEKMEVESFIKIGNSLILCLCTWIALQVSDTLFAVFVGYICASILNFLVTGIYLKKRTKIGRVRPQWSTIKELLILTIPFFLGGLLIYGYGDSSILWIKKYLGETEVGIYSAAYKTITYVYILFNAVSLALFKKLVDARKNQAQFKSLLHQFIKVLGGIALLVMVFFWFGKEIIFQTLYPEFNESIPLFVTLLPLILIKSLSYVYGNTLSTLSQEYLRLAIQGTAAGVGILCFNLFIPHRGIVGACGGILCGEIVLLLGYFVFSRREIKRLPHCPTDMDSRKQSS